jgi:hypothetical protein
MDMALKVKHCDLATAIVFEKLGHASRQKGRCVPLHKRRRCVPRPKSKQGVALEKKRKMCSSAKKIEDVFPFQKKAKMCSSVKKTRRVPRQKQRRCVPLLKK